MIGEKNQLIAAQQADLQKVQRESTRRNELYQKEQLDGEAFGNFLRPLEERRKQLE